MVRRYAINSQKIILKIISLKIVPEMISLKKNILKIISLKIILKRLKSVLKSRRELFPKKIVYNITFKNKIFKINI